MMHLQRRSSLGSLGQLKMNQTHSFIQLHYVRMQEVLVGRQHHQHSKHDEPSRRRKLQWPQPRSYR